MKRILKQSVGIDVAQKELVVQIGRLYEDLSTELYAYECFANTAKGFILLSGAGRWSACPRRNEKSVDYLNSVIKTIVE